MYVCMERGAYEYSALGGQLDPLELELQSELPYVSSPL